MPVREHSIDAHNELVESGIKSKMQRMVYTALKEHGPCTATELFRKMEKARGAQSNQNVVTRLGELRDRGVVDELRKRPCSHTGKLAIEWKVNGRHPVKFEKPKEQNCPHCNGRGKITSQQARLF